MKYVNLGNSGLKVSQLCMGCMTFGSTKWMEWALEEAESLVILKKAWDLGINFFDTADLYSNGENIDLYIIHRWDDETPIEETMDTLHELVKCGKVRYIGASTMYAWQFAKAQNYAEKKGLTKFISMQNLYNLIYREEEREMIPLCLNQKVAITPWSPLAKGILARAHQFAESEKIEGSTKRADTDFVLKSDKGFITEGDKETLKRVSEIAKKKNVEPAQIAIAWLLSKPVVACPIIGATKASNVELNVKACEIELTKEEVSYLDGAYLPKAVQGMIE